MNQLKPLTLFLRHRYDGANLELLCFLFICLCILSFLEKCFDKEDRTNSFQLIQSLEQTDKMCMMLHICIGFNLHHHHNHLHHHILHHHHLHHHFHHFHHHHHHNSIVFHQLHHHHHHNSIVFHLHHLHLHLHHLHHHQPGT